MKRKIIWIILFSIFAISLIILAAICYLNYRINNANSRTEFADLDDNSVEENYLLKNREFYIIENSKIIWQTPEDWKIDDFVIADSNNDGILDVNLSLWKKGDFGTSKPFWIKENDMSVKNHFFIYDLVDGTTKQIWGSSNLSVPNCRFMINDIDGDGKNELIVIEGSYNKFFCKGEYLAVWRWNGWGFSNEWRSGKGNFYNFDDFNVMQGYTKANN